MATLGRALVLVNGFAALTLLMWSVALYANRVNWFTDKAGNKENVGMVERFDQQFKDRNKVFLAANARWERNAYNGPTNLLAFEKEREDRREFYRDNLLRVSEGKTRDGKSPPPQQLIKVLKRDAGNIRLDMASGGYYGFGRGGLESINSYVKKVADARDQLDLKQKEALALVKGYEALTREISGTPDPRTLGLRDLIKEQEAIDAGAQSGTAYLIPIITERNAQTDIFLERNATLRDRLTVLESYLQKRKTNVSRE